VTSERSFRNVQDSAAGNVVFLYRLVEGRSSKSHGYECALSAGVPHAVRVRDTETFASQRLTQCQPVSGSHYIVIPCHESWNSDLVVAALNGAFCAVRAA
jgi:DNA mismatch repair ATPase MutS